MDEFTPLNLFGNGDADNAAKAKEETPSAEVETKETTVIETVEEQVESEADEKDPETISETVGSGEATEEKTTDSEETVEEEPQPDKLDKVLESQQQLLKQLEDLNALFNARIMHTEHEEKIVDQMHKELQKYKEDMYAQLVRPILLDVIEVRDSIMRMAATYLAKPEGEQNIPNKTVSDYAFDLQDILEKNSVEIYRSKTGDDFTPIKQRVIKKVATADETLHGKVAESLSCGYSYNGRTISAEKITVYYFEKPVEENKNSEVIENG